MMNTLIEKNKKKLLEEKDRLESLLARVASKDETNGDFHAKYPDFGSTEEDNAAEVAAYEMNIAEEHDLELKLNRVSAALARIDKGNYGICAVGGEDIQGARLEAVPEAENCVQHDNAS